VSPVWALSFVNTSLPCCGWDSRVHTPVRLLSDLPLPTPFVFTPSFFFPYTCAGPKIPSFPLGIGARSSPVQLFVSFFSTGISRRGRTRQCCRAEFYLDEVLKTIVGLSVAAHDRVRPDQTPLSFLNCSQMTGAPFHECPHTPLRPGKGWPSTDLVCLHLTSSNHLVPLENLRLTLLTLSISISFSYSRPDFL